MLILIYVINYNYEKNKKEINIIYIEFEDLMNEICKMGINPIQLFNTTKILFNFFSDIQGKYFDISDRLFYDIKLIYDANYKFQELIP